MYDISYSNSASKFIKKIPKREQDHILSVIERARIRPESHFKRLVGQKTYKLRAGDYIIIADIYEEKLFILIIKIGHRRNIYD